MRFAFVQTYPIYHDGVPVDEWISINGREMAMAAHLAGVGHDVEFWAVGERGETLAMGGPGSPSFPLRIFPPRRLGGRTGGHVSPGLVGRAREFQADLHLLKGTNGGAGLFLLGDFLVPSRREFAFILGGGHYSRAVPMARFVFYQSLVQRVRLEDPGSRFWRKAVPSDRLIYLPKAVDCGLFSPEPETVKEWDILVACRLVDRIKNLGVLGRLGRHFRVAVAGSGPDEARLRKRFPGIAWLGRVPHAGLPAVMRAARIFMHTGLREDAPRVVSEALSCGVPVVAFAGRIAPEAVPPGCGLLVPERDPIPTLAALLADEPSRQTMGRAARAHAVAHTGPASFVGPTEDMLRRYAR